MREPRSPGERPRSRCGAPCLHPGSSTCRKWPLRGAARCHLHGGHAEPNSPEAWRAAVDLAALLLAIDAAEQYGLIAGSSPSVNVPRCQALLARGLQLGYRPRPMAELIAAAFRSG